MRCDILQFQRPGRCVVEWNSLRSTRRLEHGCKIPGASSKDRIALLPHGEARIERAGHVRVNIPGDEQTLEAVRIWTLRSEAAELWLNRDGTLFAASEGPLMLSRRGWESALSQLRSRTATSGP